MSEVSVEVFTDKEVLEIIKKNYTGICDIRFLVAKQKQFSMVEGKYICMATGYYSGVSGDLLVTKKIAVKNETEIFSPHDFVYLEESPNELNYEIKYHIRSFRKQIMEVALNFINDND